MVKQRFDASDVRAMVRDLRGRLLGMRLSNLYDVNAKTYLLKLAEPGRDREFLVLESGVRFHSSRFELDKNPMPSGFSMKLRKHLRTKRFEDLRQLGTDRVVILSFGVGESRNHVILEMYSQGNIVLTGPDYTILALLRVHDYDSGASARVGAVYPLADATTVALHAPLVEKSTLEQQQQQQQQQQEALGEALEGTETGGMSSITVDGQVTVEAFRAWVKRRMQELQLEFERKLEEREASGKGGRKSKLNGPATVPLKSLVLAKGCSVSVFGASIVEHALLTAGVKPATKIPTAIDALDDPSKCMFLADPSEEACEVSAEAPLGSLGRCLFELSRCAEVFSSLDRPGQQGYIVLKDQKRQRERKEPSSEAVAEEKKQGAEEAEVYLEFLPALLKQHENLPVLVFESFDEAVDKYFGSLESQKLAQQAAAAEASAKRKLDAIKGDHSRRVDHLKREERRLATSAQAVQDSAEIVDEALKVVQSALEYNVTWSDLQQLVAAETAAGHPVASCIAALRLDDDIVEMSLPVLGELEHDENGGEGEGDELTDDPQGSTTTDEAEEPSDEQDEDTSGPDDAYDVRISPEKPEDADAAVEEAASASVGERPWWDVDDEDLLDLDWDEEEKPAVMVERAAGADGDSRGNVPARTATPTITVELQLGETAHANARRLWAERRAAAEKLEKTEKVSDSVLARAEQATKQQLEATNVKRELQAARKKLWFEKFHFFVTTENYLVIGGRDAQQNELLVRRYLRQGDAYVHADLHGAASCILRNKDPSGKRQLSPIALAEAGHFCVCRSSAWAAKTSGCTAWWVHASQVSKSAPSGEYLPTGSFMIRGRKNYLPTVPLELGIGMLFYLHEESAPNHKDERYDRFVASDVPEQAPLVEEPEQSEGATEHKDSVEEVDGSRSDPEAADAGESLLQPGEEETDQVAEEDSTSPTRRKGYGALKDAPSPAAVEEAVKELAQLSKGDFLRQGRVMPKEKKILKRRQGVTIEQIREEEAERRMATRRKQLEDVVYYDERAEQAARDAAAEEEARALNGNVRGKKGKLRKMKRKYKDQDAEDRRLAEIINHGGNAALAQALADEADAFTDSLSEQGSVDEPDADSKEAWAALVNESEAILAQVDQTKRQALEAAASEAGIKLSGADADVSPAELPQLLTLSLESIPAVFQAFRTILQRYTAAQSANFRSRALRGKVSRALAHLIRRAAALEEEAKERREEIVKELAESVGNLDASEEAAASEPLSRRALARKEQAEIAALLEEEGVGALEGAGDGSDVDVLNRLTGKPLPGDILLNAVPVIAPYATVLPYRYRAKLIPGRGKKGRVGKQALDTMSSQAEEEEQRKLRILRALHAEGDSGGEKRRSAKDVQAEIDLLSRQRALIRAVADPDLAQQMVGDASLSLSSAQKSKKGNSKAKRGKKKS